MGSTTGVAVVIPVRDGGSHVAACLATIIAETEPCSAEVLVVDDGSSDGSAAVAEAAGARVIRLPRPVGPYAARNIGWRESSAGIVAFTDVRNRARPGWLESLVVPLADPSVTVSGGLVSIGGDRRLAHRLSRRDSHVDARRLLDHDFLPFVTTSSMAVRRSALEAVDGFVEVRSGADADLCWRIQLAGLGRIEVASDSNMGCEPRAGVIEVCRQWRRYARADVELRTRFADRGAVLHDTRSIREHLRTRLHDHRASAERDLALEVADLVRWIAYELAYRRALRKLT